MKYSDVFVDETAVKIPVQDELKNYLTRGVVKVIFTKKDGTDRTMLATLNESLIPDDKKPKGTGKKAESTNTFSVYDVEVDGWRSFNYDTVKEVDYGNLDNQTIREEILN